MLLTLTRGTGNNLAEEDRVLESHQQDETGCESGMGDMS
jgi:hypothetical protein